MQRLPVVGRPPGRLDPGPQLGQDQDLRAGPGDRRRASSRRWPTSTTLQVAVIWVAAALTARAPGPQYLLDGRAGVPARRSSVRIEIVAVGTELLLGQIADTNSAWLGEHLAATGVASHFHQAVGDNHDRITLALRTALARSDGVIVCGGLGPTQDDITREAIAEVMDVAAGARPGDRRRHRRLLRGPGPRHVGEQRPSGRRARRRRRSSPRWRAPHPASSARSGTR